MNKKDMALVLDRHLGGALVLLCRWVKPWVASFQPLDPRSVKEIVVSKYVGLGSILLTQKLLRSLRRAFPAARITYLTFDTNRELLELMRPLIDEILIVKTSSLAGFIASSVGAVSVLKKRRADIFLDIEFFSRYSALMCFFSRPKTSVGYESPLLLSRTSLYSHPAKFIPQIHIIENFANQARTLGIEVSDGNGYPELELSGALIERTSKKIHALRLPDNGFFIFNASGVAGGFRKWPKDKWAELVRLSLEKYSASIVFTGLSSDRHGLDDILALCLKESVSKEKISNLAGQLGFYEYLTLIQKSRLVVTIDSAPSHLAVSLKKPTVVLFGPEWPGLYGYEASFCRIVYKGLYCSPCYQIHNGKKIICRNENRCMTTITSREVLAEMEKLVPNA